jgi:predicted nucleotidyltransferase component of viral defense system
LGGSGSGKEIRIVIGKNELVYNPPVEKEISIPYSDLVNEKFSLLCYTLDEIVAEKMRSLMQRSSSRDVYDVWYLLEMDGHVIEDCIFAFQEKARFKNVDPKILKITVEKKVQDFAKHWRDHLSYQMKTVPDYHDVWRELEKYWRRYQKFIDA